MTTKERAEKLWAMLEEHFGITTMEQFEEAYAKLPKMDISIFVTPLPEEETTDEKKTHGFKKTGDSNSDGGSVSSDGGRNSGGAGKFPEEHTA